MDKTIEVAPVGSFLFRFYNNDKSIDRIIQKINKLSELIDELNQECILDFGVTLVFDGDIETVNEFRK